MIKSEDHPFTMRAWISVVLKLSVCLMPKRLIGKAIQALFGLRRGFAPAKSDDFNNISLNNWKSLGMPNQDQLFFVLSFLGTFFSLIAGTRLLVSYLTPQNPDPDSWAELFVMAWAPGDSSAQVNRILAIVTGLIGTALFVYYINSKSELLLPRPFCLLVDVLSFLRT